MQEQPTAKAQQDFAYIVETGRDGILHQTTPRSHVVDLIQRALDSGKPIVLHLHGGLVSGSSGYTIVNLLQKKYLDAGFFPIFIVWHTGILDAVRNARELTERPLFDKLLRRLLKHFVAKYGGPGGKERLLAEAPDDSEIERELQKRYVGGEPYDDVEPRPASEHIPADDETHLVASVSQDDQLRREFEREVKAPETLPGGKELQLTAEVVDEARREFAKADDKALVAGVLLAAHAIIIAARVIRRFYRHRDHGLYTTIVEEIIRRLYIDRIGTRVWGFMKKDAADTFMREGEKPERGGWLIMSLLGHAVKERQAANLPLPRVSIVGHSAGCIYAGHLLTYLDEARAKPSAPWYNSPFVIDKLVFLAPAATCRTFAAVLRKHAAMPLFGAFRMYALTDKDERSYYEVPVLYLGSLLYIISGLLETFDDGGSGDMPLTGMQRYSRAAHPFAEPEVLAVWRFLQSKPDQLVWSGDRRGPGLNCDAKKHGQLDSTAETIRSFLHFLQ